MRLNLNSILPAPEPVLNRRSRIIPVSDPLLNGNEIKYLTDCIKTGWISSLGGYVEKFEKGFSKFCKVKYAVSVSSGTSALHLALASLGIGRGDEVIMPSFTMVSTANAVVYQGAKLVLVDSEIKTFCIDPAKIEEKITDKTKAIIVVHIYGHPARMDEVLKIARKHRLYVIEDAAEAHGAEYRGKRVGSIGDIGCFSFYGNKIITTGEGGMLVTSNKRIKEKAEFLRDLAFSKEGHFWHKELGFNYRMSNLQAAVGLAQLERVEEFIKIKRRNAYFYNKFLKGTPGIILPPEEEYAKNVFWMYAILVNKDFGITRNELRAKLAAKGIETRIFFIPIHLQPVYSKICRGKYPVSEELCRKGLYLPSGFNLKQNEIKFISKVIRGTAN